MKKWLRRAFIGFLFLMAGQFLLGIFMSWSLSRRIRDFLPPGSEFESVHWHWPLGVEINRLRVVDPRSLGNFLLKAEKTVLEIPVWGALIRPLPVQFVLKSPVLRLTSDNCDLVIGEMKLHPEEWLLMPFLDGIDSRSGEKGSPLKSIPFLPIGLRVENGRVDVVEESIRAGEPLFIADHVNLSLNLSSMMANPVIQLKSHGDFVTREGSPVGFHDVDIKAQPARKAMAGLIRLRYEQLSDFKNLYQDAPRPVLIDGGIADFDVGFDLTPDGHLVITAGCTVKDLDLSGKVEGGTRWADIMHAVEDSNRVYSWKYSVDGYLGEAGFNPHDEILAEVEKDMKQRALEKGVAVSGEMFFYEHTLSAEDAAAAEQPPAL